MYVCTCVTLLEAYDLGFGFYLDLHRLREIEREVVLLAEQSCIKWVIR